jgi:hypothetical protein
MSTAALLNELDAPTELEDLDLDVRISFNEDTIREHDGFGTPGGHTSPNLTSGVQSMCVVCCA